jgi:hypothetical protein
MDAEAESLRKQLAAARAQIEALEAGASKKAIALEPIRNTDPKQSDPRGPVTPLDQAPKLVRDPVVSRCITLLQEGNIRGARILLERAAQKGNAMAYYVLAQTFDSLALQQWPVGNAKGEPRKAKELYARALERGVEEARAAMAALEPF